MVEFIELSLFKSGKKVLVNLSNLGDIIPADNGGCKITYWRSETNDFDLWVRESYDEIIDIFHKSFRCDIVNNPNPDEACWEPFDNGSEGRKEE